MIDLSSNEVLLIARGVGTKVFILRNRTTQKVEMRIHHPSGGAFRVVPKSDTLQGISAEVSLMFLAVTHSEPKIMYVPEGLAPEEFLEWLRKHDLIVERPAGRVN